jgi:hypothetical protein
MVAFGVTQSRLGRARVLADAEPDPPAIRR